MSLANRMAIASDLVSALTVEADEFPELSRRHGVQGVPRTVINGSGAFVGALPEAQFVAASLQLAGVKAAGMGEDEEEGSEDPDSLESAPA